VATLASRRLKSAHLVLLAAPGFNIADTLKRQLAKALPANVSRKPIFAMIDQLRRGQVVQDYRGPASQFFRPSLQPFLISWMAHDPAKRLTAFKGQILIVQGTRDLQIGPEAAARLKAAKPTAALVTIKGMNHVLKAPGPGRAANVAAYSKPDLPLASGLIDAVARFLNATR